MGVFQQPVRYDLSRETPVAVFPSSTLSPTVSGSELRMEPIWSGGVRPVTGGIGLAAALHGCVWPEKGLDKGPGL